MRNVVALVPGFLGFDHLGGWTYWADRFLAGLRCRLEARRPGPIPVLAVPTPGIGSLAARQEALLRNMRALEAADPEGRPYRWHLVGHSTGGLDAALLARTHRLEETSEGSRFSRQVLEPVEIGSITTIATPHYGTCLALAPIAELRAGHFSAGGVAEAVRAGVDIFARHDKSLTSRVKFALGSAFEGSAIKFVHGIVFNDRLAVDLRPEVSAKLTREPNRRTDVPIYCIATMAPTPDRETKDKLFRDLWTFTQERAEGATPAPPDVDWKKGTIIASREHAGLLPAGPRDSDGVVNTTRQVDRDGPRAEYAGLVIADHGDVIGLYHRIDPIDGEPIEPGLLTSSADFKDDQFFEMLALVAKGILKNVPEG
jgi:pimeloyl-ACP methyl ester carboxylesterase